MATDQRTLFVPVGNNPAQLFGMDAQTRACRIAENIGLEASDSARPSRHVVLANMDFAWDPAWLREISNRSGAALTLSGTPVLVNVPADRDAGAAIAAIESGETLAGYELIDAETGELNNEQLRKRERPFVMPLDPANPILVEKAAYDGAYKGVTDILTLYLWRKPAFHLTRWAAQAGMTPNMVTLIGAVGCVLAFYLFWIGSYWLGIAAGFVFMVLDTVDGKLARCTGASSKWGNVFDHGIDLIHPPFWWWAWIHGLDAYGTPIEPVYAVMLLWAIVGGYVAQRIIEGVFMRRFGRMHIHVWRPIDSKFRLITARRNPNMVILFFALLFQRPDTGIELVALWTLVSLIFHAVRLAQANAAHDRGQKIVSWLA
ncbi:CDP-alcohol phosphatidyltransferase family protein [Sphingomonas daechungensis]|uniref:CDP-alcohol phosphatidyltransferase family protein n=1 Tax=Sphingomonas daechungensis TaxID=1176646 RepID=A0ABX6T3D1_9SPHN|nr:CDP-alcohol phosphatidyltransferase family protein [Sphingomonas daechungensis]QNP44299.1 CDP-alcohol phosphatidyltransferase family protein [Sphingomonas daechungensis]